MSLPVSFPLNDFYRFGLAVLEDLQPPPEGQLPGIEGAEANVELMRGIGESGDIYGVL